MNLIILSGLLGVVMMFNGLFFTNKRTNSFIAIGAIAFLFIANVWELKTGSAWFQVPISGMLEFSSYGLLINSILLLAGFFYFVLSSKEVENVGKQPADYYALIFFIYVGVGIVTSYTNLLMLFLGIEIISIPLYILTGCDKKNLKGNEAALKYFLMGAFSTGLMLMGIALIYGATGSFNIDRINNEHNYISVIYGGVIAGIILMLVSMCFKVSAAPFHFWTPDVYDGAPTVFTSFMATVVKIAAFIAFIRLFEGSAHTELKHKWQLVLAIIIACTLLIGNITAVFQQSVKRMLAYSSISQAGFMLFALFAFNPIAREGIVLYAAAYCFATIGIFAVLSKMDDYTYEGFNGFAKKEPMLAALLTVFLLSLAGIPLTAGFFSKYFMIAAALLAEGKYLWLIIVAVLCAAVSVYYYFRVIQAMYFKNSDSDARPYGITVSFKYVLLLLAVLVIILGINPQMVLQYLYF